MFGRLVALIAGVVLILAKPAFATVDTVYVDNGKACPGGPGTSLSNAYCNIVTALANTSGPDKVVAVVGNGSVYREASTINVPRTPADSGTIGHPFVLMARGEVTIDAANATSSWTRDPDPNKSTVWRTLVPANATVNQVFLDGVTYPYVVDGNDALPNLPPGRCKLDAAADSVYVNFGAYALWQAVSPAGTTGYVSLRGAATGAIATFGSNVSVQGFTVRRSNNDGIHIVGAVRNVTIAQCKVYGSYRQGIMPDENQSTHHCVIEDNVSSENGSYGILLPDANTDFSILRNTCASNIKVLAYLDSPPGRSSINGIRLGESGAPGLHHNHLVEGNIASHNQDTGIEIRTNYTTLRHNQSWSNQDHGFDHLFCTNVTHIGDLSWGNNRDGMSFENSSNNITLSNCVIANNGRDRCRRDWELEILGSAQTNLSSDFNVIWRDTASEPLDDVLVNLENGLDSPECGNSNCSGSGTCFKTLAAYHAAFPALEGHSKAGQPTFVDSAGGNFIPLSSSSVIDAANSGISGYVLTDVRGYSRHDAHAVEPNTGSGTIDYADIGPFEFDASEIPTAPTISVVTSQNELVVTWSSTQYNGDQSSSYQVFVGGGVVGSGSPAPPGGTNCVHTSGLNACAIYPVYVTITDVNTGFNSSSSTVNAQTKCSGATGIQCSGSRPLAGGNGLTGGDGKDVDQPLSLTLRAGSSGAQEIAYAIPRSLTGAPMDLGVFDVAGRRVLTLSKGAAKAGRYSAPLTQGQAGLKRAGVYFVHLRAGGETLGRMVVVR
jgi:hypothetical protein